MNKMKRAGGKRKSSDRFVGHVEPNKRFLIVCEGEKTEPNYFLAFRVSSNVEVHVIGEGYNTISLVERAIQLASEEFYDQVWCVFDLDGFSLQSFNSAITLAEQKGFRVAYSNEAFELWYLLHYHYLNTGVTRDSYISKLEKELGRKYKKNDPKMYTTLLSRQSDAIRNARQLLSTYGRSNPARDNPSTKVYELVEELNKHTKDALLQALINK